ncbi:MAG: hypothetical protein KKF67_02905 [Nanoarchaeota archaeon]|nr:hypothetical protein [Nanoarchaeota archaeon]
MKITNIFRSSKRTLTNFLLPVFVSLPLLFGGCAMNAYDLAGIGVKYRAIDPRANLTDRQRLGGGIAAGMLGTLGDREFEKGLRNENEKIDINIPDYSIGTRVHVKGDTVIWTKKGKNHWLAYDVKTGEYIPFTPSTDEEIYRFINRPK